MPKHATKAPNPQRPSKKARVDPSPKPPASRAKGSPRPPKRKTVEVKGPLRSTPASSSIKGKGKEVASNNAAQKEHPVIDVLPSTFKVVAGSYEKLLYGLEGGTSLEEGELKFHLKPLFIFPAHVSCIKAVAASPKGGKWLATGSADEIVKVWDLRRRKEIGGLMQHEGSITHLSFPSRSHLLSASEDGTLCLFRARDWAVLRSLRGHKGRVNSVAVHPSGKVALTVGKDKALRMWDLMRGKGCASTKLGKEGEVVRWSTKGDLFIVQTCSTIDVYNIDMDLTHTIKHPSRLHDAKFCERVNGEGEVLLVGAEDNKVTIYDISKDREIAPKIIAHLVGHSNRVKALQTLQIALPVSPSGKTSTTIVSTVSSDGKIHIYDLGSLPAPSSEDKVIEISPVAEYDSKGTRLTCVTLADGAAEGNLPGSNGNKSKSAEDGDDSGGEDGDHSDDEDAYGPAGGDEEGEEEEEEEGEGEEELEEEAEEESD